MFIAVINPSWDSSTWMAHEIQAETNRKRDGRIKRIFHYNPEQIEVKAAGLLPYLQEELPDNLDGTIRILKSL